MKFLLTAIYNKYATNSTLTGLATLYHRPAKEPTYPYVVMTIVSDNTDAISSGAIEDFVVQFSIYDDNATIANVSAILGQLTTTFDNCELTFADGFKTRKCERVSFRDLSDGDIWCWSVDYNIQVLAV